VAIPAIKGEMVLECINRSNHMGTFNGQDLIELIKSGRDEKPEKEKPSSVVEKAEDAITKIKYGPKSMTAFRDHNMGRMEKGLPALTLKEFQELTGVSE
jgi:hypothetical protein